MILRTKHIVDDGNTCTIYASQFRRICALVGCCIIGVFFLCVQNKWITPALKSPTLKTLPTSFWVCADILICLGICWCIKDLIYPPKPIVLTKKGVLFPTGRFERWENVISIYLVIHFFNHGYFCVQTNKNNCLTFGDSRLYADTQTLVSLFEHYAGKKLYAGIRYKEPPKVKAKKQKKNHRDRTNDTLNQKTNH